MKAVFLTISFQTLTLRFGALKTIPYFCTLDVI